MKTLLLLFITITTLFSNELNWLHDYTKALQKAHQEHKKIYIFIGADRCNFCKMFKEKTLSQKNVIKRLTQEYIPVYLSRDRHTIPPQFEKFGVPRHYFLNEDGSIIFETFGVLEPEGFFTVLDEAELSTQD